MSESKYNPANIGKRFNQDAQPMFTEITFDDRRAAEEALLDLIDEARQNLFGKDENE